MTDKQRMLAALNGTGSDRIPFAPRLDLWYAANRRAGTLPAEFRNASLMQICDDCGFGFHAVVPNFRDLRGPEDDRDRALGIYNLHTMPYRTELPGVRRNIRIEGDRTFVKYDTPVGSFETVVLYDEAMRTAGISITHVEGHAIRSTEHYGPVGYCFEHAAVEPNHEGYAAFAEAVGERGLTVAYFNLAGSPMQMIQRELMRLDHFFFEMTDHPDEMAKLIRQIGIYYDRVLDCVCGCGAEVVLLGANYDAAVTFPPFFAEHITPYLRRCARRLHERGMRLLTHTDGENTGLLDEFLAAEIDVADSICPAPMTKLTFKQVRDHFAGRVSIMGGVPSVMLLAEIADDAEFGAFLDDFFTEAIGAGDHLILGISDTTPPAADFARILEIARRVEAFGPVPATD